MMVDNVNIGEFDRLVTLQKCVITTGPQGQKKSSFADFAKVFAKVERSDSETIMDDNLESDKSLVVTTYKHNEVTTRWRVVVDGLAYEIRSIDNGNRMSPFMRLLIKTIEK